MFTLPLLGQKPISSDQRTQPQKLTELEHMISRRVDGFLEREGILERDEENSYLNLEKADEVLMQQVLGCHRQDPETFAGQGRVAAANKSAALYAELSRFGLVGIDPFTLRITAT